MRPKIIAFSGSARTASINEKILYHIAANWGDALAIELYQDLANLPLFNPDRDKDPVPEIILALRKKIAHADGILICTPEYIFSPPAALKNMLEWMVSVTVLSDKPAALIVASGVGEKTMESLTLILDTLGVKTTSDTRLLIQGARSKIDAAGNFADEGAAKSVGVCVEALLALVVSAK